MTDKQQPDKFDWATELLDAQGHVTLSKQEAKEIGARLRSMGAKLNTYEDLGGAADDVQILRMGYAAARLEIESLKSQLHAAKQINAAQFTLLAASIPGAALRPPHVQAPAQAAPESFLEIPDVQDESGINSHYSRELVLECINSALASHGQAPAGAALGSDAIYELIHGFGHTTHAQSMEIALGIADLSPPSTTPQAAPAAVAGQSEFPHEQMDVMALARYKVVPAHESMFHRFAVVAGDGKQQLYIGREVECENMARKFAGAFLDGAFAFHSMRAAAPTTQPAPQQEAQEPAFWTVCAQYEGGDETGWIPLPGYSNETEHGVKNLVLQAARKEGYKGTATGRLMELNWEIRPVYLAPWVAPQPSPVAQGCALDVVLDAFENKTRGIPQAHIAAALVAELRAAIEAASTTPTAQGDALDAAQLEGKSHDN